MQLDLTRYRQPLERFDRTFSSDEVGAEADPYRIVAPVHVAFDIHKDKDKFRLVGNLETELELACSRCLEPYRFPLSAPFDLRYLPASSAVFAEGEHEMDEDDLEISYRQGGNVSEAPLQLKSNCGCLLIDDFGRQRVAPAHLLNRWIVPLESQRDFLTLANGKKIQVPFEQLIIFSTNLVPEDLVDEAFLRRIPYKIEVKDPAEEQFRDLFLQLSAAMGLACTPEAVEYVLDTHYRQTGRGMRFCHPRDLLRQIQHRATLHDLPTDVTPEGLDAAVENYFSVM